MGTKLVTRCARSDAFHVQAGTILIPSSTTPAPIFQSCQLVIRHERQRHVQASSAGTDAGAGSAKCGISYGLMRPSSRRVVVSDLGRSRQAQAGAGRPIQAGPAMQVEPGNPSQRGQTGTILSKINKVTKS